MGRSIERCSEKKEFKIFPPFKEDEFVSDVKFESRGSYGSVYSCKIDGKDAVFKISRRRGNFEEIKEAYHQLVAFCELEGNGLLKIPRILNLRSVFNESTNERINLIFMEKLGNILCRVMNKKNYSNRGFDSFGF